MCMLCSVNTKICPPAPLPNLTPRLDFSQRKPFRKWKWMHLSQSLVWIVLMGCHDKYWQLAEGSRRSLWDSKWEGSRCYNKLKACLRRGRMQWEGKGKLAGRRAGDEITQLAASRSPAWERSWVLGMLQMESKGKGFCVLERRGAAETSGGSRVNNRC